MTLISGICLSALLNWSLVDPLGKKVIFNLIRLSECEHFNYINQYAHQE